MRWPRVRIWWLMALVAAVAWAIVAIPYWWNWHHEMLARSWKFTVDAEIMDEQVRLTREDLEWIRSGRFYRWDSNGPASPPEDYEKAAAWSEETARAYRRAATFPWLGDPNLRVRELMWQYSRR